MKTPVLLRLQAALDSFEPHEVGKLNGPASEAEIAELEALIGVRLPDEVRAIYLECNGQHPDSKWFLIEGEWLSIARIAQEWKVWKELLDGGDFKGIKGQPEGAVKDDWWNPKWIPLTYDGCGNHNCLDLDPAEGGTVGQIIDLWHDEDSRSIDAASLSAFLEEFVSEVEAGKYVYEAELGVITHVDVLMD